MPLIKCRDTYIGHVNLNGSRPSIAVSIYDRDADSLIHSLSSDRRRKEALYEIRYDLFHRRNGTELRKMLEFLNGTETDYIFTFRSDDRERLSEFYGIASDSGVPAADVEIDVYDAVGKDTRFKTMMLSHHSYEGESVLEKYRSIASHRPQIVKLASKYADFKSFQNDFVSLQKLKEKDSQCLSFIPMGKENSFLRIMSAYVLSDIVYAKETDSTAEGQLTEKEYLEFFRLF